MMKINKYLFVIFVSGIFVLSVSAVGAQQRFPAKDPQSATSDEEKGKAGIIVIDSVITDPKAADKPKPRSAPKIEPGDTFQPQPGANIRPGDTLKTQPGTKGAVINDTEEAGPY